MFKREPYDKWLEKVANAVFNETGMFIEDMDDYDYRSAYGAGMLASAAARKAIKNAMLNSGM
jgi:hypothetical protein